MDIRLARLSDRPELASSLYDFPGAWPSFLYHDLATETFYAAAVARNPDLCLVAYDSAAPDRLIAKATALPISWDGDDASLPPTGYDALIVNSVADSLAGRRGTCVGATEIVIQLSARGIGLARRLLLAMCENAATLGYQHLLAAVRPNRKHEHPDMPMPEYARLTRDDGLPADPWLRVHRRAGGRVAGLAPASMTVVGDLARWRAWTGLPFDTPGPVYVPEALAPVWCDLANDWAAYVEPNVWVHHSLT